MGRQLKPKGNKNAKILVIGDFPTAEDVRFGEAFATSAYSGSILDDYLAGIGVRRHDICVMYACQERPPKGDILEWVAKKPRELGLGYEVLNGLWISPEIQHGINECKRVIDIIKPNLIITMGNLALWAVTGNWGAINWRGSLIKNELTSWSCKVIPTVSVADINANPEWKPVIKYDFARVKKHWESLEFPDRTENFIVRPTKDQVIKTLEFLKQRHRENPSLVTACDIETRGGDISCIGFGWSRNEAICIPFMDVTKPEGYWSEEDELEVRIAVYDFLLNYPQVGQNFKYDKEFIYWKDFIEVNWVRDTMITHHSFLPTGKIDLKDTQVEKVRAASAAEKKGLGFLSSIYCKDHLYWKDEREDWENEEEYWIYNCRDCVRTYEIDTVQQVLKVKKHPKQESVTDFQNGLIEPVWQIMKRGMKVDRARHKEFTERLQEAKAQRLAWIREVVGHELNYGSSKQMQEFFYTDLKMKPVKKRNAKGFMAPTCDDAALSKLAQDDPLIKPLCDVIQECRSIDRFLSTFLEARLHPDDRFRFSINIAGTKTFRFSSSKTAFGYGTNSENIPANQAKRPGEIPLLPDIRTIYIPDKGKVIADTDLDSADLRIVVEESDCEEMRVWFREGKKPYVEVAKEYYKDQSITKAHWAYKLFKSLCHGCITGDHEVLTPKGWVRVDKITDFQEIAVWDLKTKQIKFELPDGWNRDTVLSGEALMSFSGEAFSQLTTLDHKFPYTVDTKDNLSFTRADSLPSSSRLPVAGYYSGAREEPEAIMRLYAAFQADGTFAYGGKARWHLKKERKIERIKLLLTSAGFEFKPYQQKDGSVTIEALWYPEANRKVYGPYMLEYSANCLDFWLDELQYWDGYRGDTKAIHISTIDSNSAEWIQTIAHLRGKGSKRYIHRKAAGNRKDLWHVSLNNRTFASLGSMTYQKIEHSEPIKVYCPKTSTGFFMVRHNGHVMVTGNTNYLGMAAGLASRCGLLVHEVERIQAWYFGKFPGIQKWQEEIKRQVQGRRYVENAFGQRAYFLGRISDDTFREAVAWIPQSTVARIIDGALVNIHYNLPQVELLNQVHDSLVMQFDKEGAEETMKKVQKEMEIIVPYPKGLIVPVGVKMSPISWGDCE